MNDDQLRELVRQSIARHFGAASAPSSAPSPRTHPAASHPSHYQYLTVVNTGDSCVIEPSVACNHCGYCKCHGH